MTWQQNRLWLFLLSLILLGGCAAQRPFGAWESDRRVGQLFESAQVLPDHTYYYLGSIAAPDSIIAIDNRYVLRSEVWARIEISEQILRDWLAWLPIAHSHQCVFRGGVILTPDGRQAGIWYSPHLLNVVQMPEPEVLVIFQPRSAGLSGCGEQDRGSLGREFED